MLTCDGDRSPRRYNNFFLLDLALNLEKCEDDEDLGRVFLGVLGGSLGPRERERREERERDVRVVGVL